MCIRSFRARRARVTQLVALLSAALLTGACQQIDTILEGTPPVDTRLSVAVDALSTTLPQGGTHALVASVTCQGDCKAAVSIEVEGLPDGVTATVGSTTTSGLTTTATITLRASAAAPVGTYTVQVRSRSARASDGTVLMMLDVVKPPALVMTVASPTLHTIRNGRAPVLIRLARTSLPPAVSLSLSGATGLTLGIAGTPVTADSVLTYVEAAANATVGTQQLTLRATVAGIPDLTLPVSVTVVDDALQLGTASPVSLAQAASATAEITVSRAVASVPMALAVEQLPSGMRATLDPIVYDPQHPTTGVARLTIDAGPSAVLAHTIRIRAQSPGVPDATLPVQVNVTSASITLTSGAPALVVLQGSSVDGSVSLSRSQFSGAVVFDAAGVPPGVSVVYSPPSTTGTAATFRVVAAGDAPVGVYAVTLRASPTGLPAEAVRTVSLSLTVRAVPPGGGNILLEWSTCTPPNWVGVQDGTGAWQRLTPLDGVYRGDVAAARGAYAFVEGQNTVVVRYLVRSELDGRPIDMCATQTGAKNIVGVATHSSAAEIFNHRLGGGQGSSTLLNGGVFTIVGVRPGMHDYIGWGTTSNRGNRAIIRRDLDLTNGESLGEVELAGLEGFTQQPATLVATGTLGSGEQVVHAMSYLTTAACTENPLYTSGPQNFTMTMFGVPVSMQRPTDFHRVTVMFVSSAGLRSTSLSFSTFANKQVAVPAILGTPAMTKLSGAYTRLQLAFGVIPQTYNVGATLRYSSGTRTMSVSASSAYLTGSSTIAMPDLSAVAGWDDRYAIFPGSSGSWSWTLDGTNGVSGGACAEGHIGYRGTRNGVF